MKHRHLIDDDEIIEDGQTLTVGLMLMDTLKPKTDARQRYLDRLTRQDDATPKGRGQTARQRYIDRLTNAWRTAK